MGPTTAFAHFLLTLSLLLLYYWKLFQSYIDSNVLLFYIALLLILASSHGVLVGDSLYGFHICFTSLSITHWIISHPNCIHHLIPHSYHPQVQNWCNFTIGLKKSSSLAETVMKWLHFVNISAIWVRLKFTEGLDQPFYLPLRCFGV